MAISLHWWARAIADLCGAAPMADDAEDVLQAVPPQVIHTAFDSLMSRVVASRKPPDDVTSAFSQLCALFFPPFSSKEVGMAAR